MDNYVTGKIIKELREKNNLTQLELANIIGVTDKTISKWETYRGLPDISLLESLAKALSVSVIELMDGEHIINKNISSNMRKSNLYVCPVCGNVFHTIGEGLIACCGVTLPKLEAELENDKHIINCEIIDDEYYVSINHEMTKEHYISFIAYITDNKCEFVKLYPEQNAETRFQKRGKGVIYIYCNREGLIKKVI